MVRITEEFTIFGLLAILILFLEVNFDPTLGSIFLGMLILDILFYLKDKRVTYEVERVVDRKRDIIYAVGAYVLFLAGTMFFVKGVTSILGSVTLFSETLPVFAGNPIFTLLALGFFVPVVESRFFFGRMLEFFKDRFNITLKKDLFDMPTWVMVLFIAGIFTIFHLTAKGLTDTGALTQVFFFGVVSVWLAILTGQLLAAVLFHMIANNSSLYVSVGKEFFANLSSTSLLVIAGLIIFFIYSRRRRS
jgi:hypothetical protein